MKPTLEYYLLVLLLLLSRLVLLSASPECPRFSCGGVSELGFPFSNTSNPACGLAVLNCTGDAPLIQFSENGKWYLVDYISGLDRTVVICDLDVQSHLESNQCGLLHNFTEKVSPFLDVNFTGIRPFFKCNREPPYPISSSFFKSFRNHSCKDSDLYYYGDRQKHLPALPQNLSSSCSVVYSSRLYDASGRADNRTLIIGSDFSLKLQVHRHCWECHSKGGQCLGSSDQTFECANLKGASVRRKVIIGIAAGFGCVVVMALLFILWKGPPYSSFIFYFNRYFDIYPFSENLGDIRSLMASKCARSEAKAKLRDYFVSCKALKASMPLCLRQRQRQRCFVRSKS